MAATGDENGDGSLWATALAAAHAVWPAAWVPREVFLDYLRARLPPDRAPDQTLPEIALADLYLACACARGVAAAVTAFSRTMLGEVDAHVARFRRSPAFADEVKQELAAKLLVAAPGEAPKIADYAGAAPLSAWVRVVAIRIALNLRRGKANVVEHRDQRAIADLASDGDADVALIRRRYGAAFETALAEALAALPTRQRTLLRLRVVDGLEVEHMATMYGVHRTTITRWLADCRAGLIEETRRLLSARLHLDRSDLDSLAGLIHSQLHVSIVRLLRDG